MLTNSFGAVDFGTFYLHTQDKKYAGRRGSIYEEYVNYITEVGYAPEVTPLEGLKMFLEDTNSDDYCVLSAEEEQVIVDSIYKGYKFWLSDWEGYGVEYDDEGDMEINKE